MGSTIEPIAEVAIADLASWLLTVPADKWPDASMGEKFRPLAEALVAQHFPGCKVSGVGLFVLEPGQIHPAHRDDQPPEWVTRVHVPILTNPHAVTTMEDGPHRMLAGTVYAFNTRAEHAVANGGRSPRVHLVFEVHL